MGSEEKKRSRLCPNQGVENSLQVPHPLITDTGAEQMKEFMAVLLQVLQYHKQGFHLQQERHRQVFGNIQTKVIHRKRMAGTLIHLLLEAQQGSKISGLVDMVFPIPAADIGGQVIETNPHRWCLPKKQAMLELDDVAYLLPQ